MVSIVGGEVGMLLALIFFHSSVNSINYNTVVDRLMVFFVIFVYCFNNLISDTYHTVIYI